MTLRQKQSKFVRMTVLLLIYADHLGYEVTFGETWRHPDSQHGHTLSLHKIRLAIDLNLFKDDKYQRSTKAHEPLGEYWESIGGAWGGRFGDGNHYSLEHNGIK